MKVFLALTLFISISQAQVSQGEIKNFNFSYTAPLGEGTADSFFYQQKLEEAQKVHVEKIGDDFHFNFEGVENRNIEFKNPPEMIKNAESIKLATFNLTLQNAISLSLSSASFQSPEQKLDLKNLTLSCDRLMSFPLLMDQAITGCLQKMVLKAGGFNSAGFDGLQTAMMKALDDSYDEILGGVGIKNADLKISSGKFQLSADIKAQISGTATANGTAKYDQLGKVITIKVSEIKFSIMDVTSQVFDELKKQESPSMKVNKPYIYLKVQ